MSGTFEEARRAHRVDLRRALDELHELTADPELLNGDARCVTEAFDKIRDKFRAVIRLNNAQEEYKRCLNQT